MPENFTDKQMSETKKNLRPTKVKNIYCLAFLPTSGLAEGDWD